MACQNVGADFGLSNNGGGYGQPNGNGGLGLFPGNWSQSLSSFIPSSGIGSTTGSDGLTDSDNDEGSRLPSQSDQRCHSTAKKRRRGIIEKKRRDRINTSLAELKLLIPAAFEKQGSQKLEKAEILQMTVEHLKVMQSKGMDPFMYDPQRFANDYLSMGYRDCATEVNRYLSDEGVGVQDPLRMRLMSHLQCYSAQRAAAMASWNTVYPPQQWGSSPYGGTNTGANPAGQHAASSYLGAANSGQSAFTPTPIFKPSANGNFSQQQTSTAMNIGGNPPAPNFSASFLSTQSVFPQFSATETKTISKTWSPAGQNGSIISR